jgi:hypothetical protein
MLEALGGQCDRREGMSLTMDAALGAATRLDRRRDSLCDRAAPGGGYRCEADLALLVAGQLGNGLHAVHRSALGGVPDGRP